MNTETIEQASENYCLDKFGSKTGNQSVIDGIMFGANWQKSQDEAKYKELEEENRQLLKMHNIAVDKHKSLIESHNELLECLKLAYDQIHISEKQIPIKDSFNLSTHTGKKAWELFSGKMLKIETTINKARNI